MYPQYRWGYNVKMNHDFVKSKALVLEKTGSNQELRNIYLDSNLDANNVLVKIKVSGICGKQLEEIAGCNGLDIYLPHLLGHEASAEVIKVGSAVKHVKTGDLVVVHWITEFDCGLFNKPKVIDIERGTEINLGPVTTFSEYTIVQQNRVTKIPFGTDPKIAALLGCGLTTGLGAVFNEAKVTDQNNVLVIGCGGVGLSVIQGCKIKGVKNIAALDISDTSLLQAELSGASQVIKYTNQLELKSQSLESFDCIFYCIGSTELLSRIHPLVSSPSNTYLVGVPSPTSTVKINARDIHQRRALLGSYGGMTKPSNDIPLYLSMISKGILNPNILIGDIFRIDQSDQAFSSARKGLGKRIQFSFS